MLKDKAFVGAAVDRMKFVVGVDKDSELADKLGAHRSAPAQWRARPSLPINELLKLAANQSASLDWLIFGRGSPSYAGGAFEGEQMKREDIANEMAETVLLPVFDCASTIDIEEPLTTWRASLDWMRLTGLSENEGETIIFISASDAMAPTIEKGQWIVIDRRPVDIDGVFLLKIAGSYRFKRLQKMVDGSLRLISDNKAYADEIVEKEQASQLEIIGVCAASCSGVV